MSPALLPAAFDHSHYVPVVLTRQGERLALRVLDPRIKDHCTPLFAVHPVPKDLDTGGPQISVDEHVRKSPVQLIRDWGTRPAMIDLQHIDPSARMNDGTHPLAWVVATAGEAGLSLAPVVGPSRDDDYRAAAFEAAREREVSVCFRLQPSEWADLPSATGAGRLLALLDESGLPPEAIHVVFDMEGDISTTPAITATAIRASLRALPHVNNWRSVTIAGTGMPAATSDVGADNSAELPRLEWLVWRTLFDEEREYRLPTFGDYCVQHPDPLSDFDPRYMQSAAQLRYTIARAWFIARGRGMRSGGTEQVRDLAEQVVAHQQFAGSDFSWGDEWISDCASRACSAGNQMVWRKAATSHHITYVVRQLATLLAS
jgi:hypothetical protein